MMTPLVIASACSNDAVRGQESFCAELRANRELLLAPVTQPGTVAPILGRYQKLDLLAPEAIRDEWHELTVLVERVAAADPRQPQVQPDLVSQAHATDGSIRRIISYAKTTCGVDMGAPSASPTTIA